MSESLPRIPAPAIVALSLGVLLSVTVAPTTSASAPLPLANGF